VTNQLKPALEEAVEILAEALRARAVETRTRRFGAVPLPSCDQSPEFACSDA
jgi:hypothetical protein